MSETTPEAEVWTEEHSNGYVHINLRASTPAGHTDEDEEQSKKDDTHTFPISLPDWSNYDVLHKNTLPPRASFFIYNSPSDALSRDVTKSKTLSLSGEYGFSSCQQFFRSTGLLPSGL